ncbi:MAG: hypothetical protein M1457_06385 [bacterium]|nr:hypothetical protein [bacterium]
MLGVLAALLTAGFFTDPSGAYPIESLGLSLALAGVGAVLTGWLLAERDRRVEALAALGSPAILAALGLALWAAARWSFMEVRAAGREWVIGLAWMGVAAATGAFMGTAARRIEAREPGSATPFALFRRVLALAALASGALALYQHFVGYPRALVAFRAENPGPVTDIQTQSLMHALTLGRVGGRLGDPNLFAAQLAVLAVFCLSLLRRGEPRAWRWLGTAGYAATIVSLLLTGSTGGILAFGFASVIGLAFAAGGGLGRMRGGGRVMAMVATGAALAALTGTAWGDQGTPPGWLHRLATLTTIRERFYYWEIALRVWAGHPWIGAGPGGFNLLYMTLKPPLAHESQYAHSWLFETGSELGAAGVGLILLFWGALAWRLWRTRRPILGRPAAVAEDSPPPSQSARSDGSSDLEAAWLLGALAVLAFNGLYQFIFQWREFLILTGLLAGGACGLTSPARPASARNIAGRCAGGLGLAMSGSALVLALIMTPPWHLAQRDRWLGRDLMDAGDWAQAAEAFARAARWEPDDPALLVAEAGARDRGGNPARAWILLQRAAGLNPRSASIPAAQASWLERQGHPREAIDKISESIDRYPSNVEYRITRARLLLATGQPAEARRDLVYIERQIGPYVVWEYQRQPYNDLRRRAGLPPVTYPPR